MEKKNRTKIGQRRKEILDHINELKVNYNALTVIRNKLQEEKKERFEFNDYAKDMVSKKRDILELIRREEDILITVSPGSRDFNESVPPLSPFYSEDIKSKGINSVLLRLIREKRTGVVQVEDGKKYGEAGFRHGKLVYVIFNGVKGERAFFDLIHIKKGRAKFYPQKSFAKGGTIDKGTSHLIKRTLEGIVSR